MGIQIGAKPDSGFDNPIGMLKDCHRRIESFLHVLCLVVGRGRGRSLSEEESAAVNSALHYFRVGGQRHTADEEESLFPRLRGGSATNALEQLPALESDHRRANELHASVEKLYLAWINAGQLNYTDERQLVQDTQELDHLYKAHIKVEEEVVFPEAASVLDRESVATMGQEFRARRE